MITVDNITYTDTEAIAYIKQLKSENARLEDAFQRATGAVAADSLPTLAELRKISDRCRSKFCDDCPYIDRSAKVCRFVTGTIPAGWTL
jgi:hypothetical protein